MDASAAVDSFTADSAAPLRLSLPFRPPFDFDALLQFFARRAIPGVEVVDARSYARTIALPEGEGWLRVSAQLSKDALALELSLPDPAVLPRMVARIRRMFDLDTDAATINAALGRHVLLRDAVRRHP